MAGLAWGKVYYQNTFAGLMHEETGGRIVFTYDEHYLVSDHPAIAHTLPLQREAHVSGHGLHPFFDNLVSEGWLKRVQSCSLGRRNVPRFELLLAFGFDCAGAVSLLDEDKCELRDALLDREDTKEIAVLTGRASLSGIQPKLAVCQKEGRYQLASVGELSTHIAKFPTVHHSGLVENEYLTTQAFSALLPDDQVANMETASISGIDEPALLIERFDRKAGDRIHFEEFNQLLNHRALDKYEGAYQDMAKFMLSEPDGMPSEVYRLYRRILAGLLLGNTDMHLKNFALFCEDGFALAPAYDQVSSYLYDYKTIALALGGAGNRYLGDLEAQHLVLLGREFKLSNESIEMAVNGIEAQFAHAKEVVSEASLGSVQLKNDLINHMERRWRGTFALIGKALSKRR